MGEHEAVAKVDVPLTCERLVEALRQWVAWEMLALETDDFEELGAAYEETRPDVKGHVGAALVRLIPQRELVDFAVPWMEEHRGGSPKYK